MVVPPANHLDFNIHSSDSSFSYTFIHVILIDSNSEISHFFSFRSGEITVNQVLTFNPGSQLSSLAPMYLISVPEKVIMNCSNLEEWVLLGHQYSQTSYSAQNCPIQLSIPKCQQCLTEKSQAAEQYNSSSFTEYLTEISLPTPTLLFSFPFCTLA